MSEYIVNYFIRIGVDSCIYIRLNQLLRILHAIIVLSESDFCAAIFTKLISMYKI